MIWKRLVFGKSQGLFIGNNLLGEDHTQSNTNRLLETGRKIGIEYHSLLELGNHHY